MQKKQVKIMGFQAENCKIKLFYETDGTENWRYIVEKNRKYITTTCSWEKARKIFVSNLMEKAYQQELNL